MSVSYEPKDFRLKETVTLYGDLCVKLLVLGRGKVELLVGFCRAIRLEPLCSFRLIRTQNGPEETDCDDLKGYDLIPCLGDRDTELHIVLKFSGSKRDELQILRLGRLKGQLRFLLAVQRDGDRWKMTAFREDLPAK